MVVFWQVLQTARTFISTAKEWIFGLVIGVSWRTWCLLYVIITVLEISHAKWFLRPMILLHDNLTVFLQHTDCCSRRVLRACLSWDTRDVSSVTCDLRNITFNLYFFCKRNSPFCLAERVFLWIQIIGIVDINHVVCGVCLAGLLRDTEWLWQVDAVRLVLLPGTRLQRDREWLLAWPWVLCLHETRGVLVEARKVATLTRLLFLNSGELLAVGVGEVGSRLQGLLAHTVSSQLVMVGTMVALRVGYLDQFLINFLARWFEGVFGLLHYLDSRLTNLIRIRESDRSAMFLGRAIWLQKVDCFASCDSVIVIVRWPSRINQLL